ncbi:hypothetical protein LY78DRAFT_501222 [Colletotrichum sublineola]|nr:hypothetical protein LY78DRAFT_501222 [Colletotrichum sublineola]
MYAHRISSWRGGACQAAQPRPRTRLDQIRSNRAKPGPGLDFAALTHTHQSTPWHHSNTGPGQGGGASPFSSPSAPLTTGLCLFRGSASDTPAHNEPPPSPLGQVTHPLPAIPTAKGKGQSVSVDCAHHPICWVITAQSPLKGGLTPSLALSAPKAPPVPAKQIPSR